MFEFGSISTPRRFSNSVATLKRSALSSTEAIHLRTLGAYAFLQHRRLAQSGRKRESTDLRLSQACRLYATPSSISSFDRQLSDAHTAENDRPRLRRAQS
ncbi:hypothetical protein ACVJGD_000160 [Bradyrhizobium sp. USDA 10063]